MGGIWHSADDHGGGGANDDDDDGDDDGCLGYGVIHSQMSVRG